MVKNLANASLHSVTLTNGTLAGANLTGAFLLGATLANADLSNAILNGANAPSVTSAGANFTGADLSDASFNRSNVAGANLTNANLTNVNLQDADLTSTNLSGANLTGANITFAVLNGAEMNGANLKNADLGHALEIDFVEFDATTVYNQWTGFPRGFNPASHGLTKVISPAGDFNGDDALDLADVDVLTELIQTGFVDRPGNWPAGMFDVDLNATVDRSDLDMWVHTLAQTWFGDANLDGEFNNIDLVDVLQAGKYGLDIHAGWADGDWDGDGRFNRDDILLALQDGGYDRGALAAVNAVPEPSFDCAAGHRGNAVGCKKLAKTVQGVCLCGIRASIRHGTS